MADLSKELSKELNKDFAYCEDALGRAENAIGNLPSAQPEKRTEERTETHACDLIDRQAAIDAIRASASKYTGFMEMEMYTDDDAVEAINGVPSVQPERKKGKWIKEHWHGEHTRRCSACNITQTVTTYSGKVNFNYCPYCGADMRGEQNE